jgi:hypothetical protein
MQFNVTEKRNNYFIHLIYGCLFLLAVVVIIGYLIYGNHQIAKQVQANSEKQIIQKIPNTDDKIRKNKNTKFDFSDFNTEKSKNLDMELVKQEPDIDYLKYGAIDVTPISLGWGGRHPFIRGAIFLTCLMLFCFWISAALGRFVNFFAGYSFAIRGAVRGLSILSGVVAILILLGGFIVVVGNIIFYIL